MRDSKMKLPAKKYKNTMSIDLVCDSSTKLPFTIDPRLLGCHTSIIAQSGSGKTFMVGRLVEELLLKTKARVIILDPNSDFVRLKEPEPSVWSNPKLKSWFFPGEDAKCFKKSWSKVQVTLLSERNLPGARPLRINWGSLTLAEQASTINIDPCVDADLYWFLTLSIIVTQERWSNPDEPYDYAFFRGVVDEICDFIVSGFGSADISQIPLAQSLQKLGPPYALKFRALVYSMEEYLIWRSVGDEEPDITDYLTTNPNRPHVIIVDLLSVSSNEGRLALVGRLLGGLWSASRNSYSNVLRDIELPDQRTPTFVLIDEAHNLVPAIRSTPAAERIVGDIVRIAAEGRKFGLRLIVVTQRPRKIDLNVLSECDNLLLMRMVNMGDMDFAEDTFGFLLKGDKKRVASLSIGEILLRGRIFKKDILYHVAPRRTREGGHDIDEDFWTSPW